MEDNNRAYSLTDKSACICFSISALSEEQKIQLDSHSFVCCVNVTFHSARSILLVDRRELPWKANSKLTSMFFNLGPYFWYSVWNLFTNCGRV